jgi:hypothetical protein
VQYLPKAVLGAVIVVAAIGLVEPQAWRSLAAIDPVEVAIAAVTTGCVIVFGVLEALVVAVGLSMIDTVRRSARPHDAVLGWDARLGRYADVSLHPSAHLTPGVVVYRLDDRLFKGGVRGMTGGVPGCIEGDCAERLMLSTQLTGADCALRVCGGAAKIWRVEAARGGSTPSSRAGASVSEAPHASTGPSWPRRPTGPTPSSLAERVVVVEGRV